MNYTFADTKLGCMKNICCLDFVILLFLLGRQIAQFLAKQSYVILSWICDKILRRNEGQARSFGEKWGVARNLGHCHG